MYIQSIQKLKWAVVFLVLRNSLLLLLSSVISNKKANTI